MSYRCSFHVPSVENTSARPRVLPLALLGSTCGPEEGAVTSVVLDVELVPLDGESDTPKDDDMIRGVERSPLEDGLAEVGVPVIAEEDVTAVVAWVADPADSFPDEQAATRTTANMDTPSPARRYAADDLRFCVVLTKAPKV